MPETTTLTPTQQQVLTLIAGGATATAAAAKTGVHRNTIGNWLRSADFQQAFVRALRDQALHWREQAASIIPEALTVIRSIMLDPTAPAGARLKAAFAILDRNPDFRPEPLPENLSFPAEQEISAPAEQEISTPNPAQIRAESSGLNVPIPPRHPAPGRNDACPCGSGRKFKRCCLGKASLHPSSPPPISAAMRTGGS